MIFKGAASNKPYSRTIQAAEGVAQIMSWIELAFFLGFSIPLLLPLLTLAIYASKLELQTMVCRRDISIEGDDDTEVKPLLYVLFSGLLMNGMAVFVFWNAGLHGSTVMMIIAGTCSCICFFIYVFKICKGKCKCKRKRKRTLDHEDSFQLYTTTVSK